MERTKMKSNFVFSDVLADNGRLTLTGDVIAAFGKMMSAHRGEVLCAVTTAQVQTAGHTWYELFKPNAPSSMYSWTFQDICFFFSFFGKITQKQIFVVNYFYCLPEHFVDRHLAENN